MSEEMKELIRALKDFQRGIEDCRDLFDELELNNKETEYWYDRFCVSYVEIQKKLSEGARLIRKKRKQ